MNVFIVKLYIRNNSRASKPTIFVIVSTVTCDKDIFSLNKMKYVMLWEIGLYYCDVTQIRFAARSHQRKTLNNLFEIVPNQLIVGTRQPNRRGDAPRLAEPRDFHFDAIALFKIKIREFRQPF